MCFCGNTYGLYGAVNTEVDNNNCNLPCSGNRRQMCGGYIRNYIYDVDGTHKLVLNGYIKVRVLSTIASTTNNNNGHNLGVFGIYARRT